MGVQALGRLGSAFGITPTGVSGTPGTGDGAYGGFFTSPGYQFRVDEGNKAIERSSSARGLHLSGAALKAIDRFTQNTASDEFGRYTAGLATLSGFGQQATAGTAAAGQASTSGIAGAYGAAGNARASSYLNTGSAINNGLNNAVGTYLYSQGGGFGGGGGGVNAYGIHNGGSPIY